MLKQATPQPDAAPRFHLGFIDGLRALAALFVVLCHAWYEPSNGFYASRLMNKLGLSYGHLAVDVFIVVSGFCLMLPLTRKGGVIQSVSGFYWRRVRRILPPYYAAVALSALFIVTVAGRVTGTVWDNSLPLTAQQLVAHGLLVHNLPLQIPGGAINYPLWSIATECQIYLLMPALVVSLRRFGALLTLGWTVLLGVVLTFGFGGALASALPWYLSLFCMGVLAAQQCGKPQPLGAGWARGGAYVLFGVVALTIVAKGKDFFNGHLIVMDTLTGAATALLLVASLQDAEKQAHWITRLLSWKPLVGVGAFSYSLYLVHAPALHGLYLLYNGLFHLPTERMFLLLAVSIPLIVGLSYLFHLAFERPFLNTRTRTESPAPAAAVLASR
ncbi:MAG: acyltransferase 3 [Armatimonadetes bacterium]|nr:acyltransferase 3 [Armatimonadota bacterium]